MSSTVKDLVVGSGIEFEDRGECELKGVPGSWKIYEVAGQQYSGYVRHSGWQPSVGDNLGLDR